VAAGAGARAEFSTPFGAISRCSNFPVWLGTASDSLDHGEFWPGRLAEVVWRLSVLGRGKRNMQMSLVLRGCRFCPGPLVEELFMMSARDLNRGNSRPSSVLLLIDISHGARRSRSPCSTLSRSTWSQMGPSGCFTSPGRTGSFIIPGDAYLARCGSRDCWYQDRFLLP
jgi:hypothetical protein